MKIDLSKIILMSIDTIDPNRTIRSMLRVMDQCQFMEAVLLTDTTKHSNVNHSGIKIVHHTETNRTFPILDDNGRVTHPDYELANLIEPANQFHGGATHILYMEHDAGIKNKSAWTPAFLNFDFIGAPWPVHGFKGWPSCDGHTNAVGNFGFSIRSKKFCELVSDRAKSSDSDARFSCDAWACRTLRHELESLGVTYAPVKLAARFSCEDQVYNGQFGFHGHMTMRINGWKE